ncbi:MAG: T9SS type A sorting domain-containing protein, partial [Gemmatimonadetes bacterium]|nr:T9SS type A sorting domain-containing protein [Gemmatimonadota bacterium]
FLAESGDLKFWYDVSTESGFDYLKFYLDGVLMDQWSGTVPWTQATYPVGSGFHTFTWTYSKDGSVNGGADAVWIDFIEMPRVTPPVYPEIAVSPGSVTETLSPGGTSTQPLTIDNTGEGELSYGISILEAPAPAPRPQELGRAVREEIDLAKGEVDPRVGDSPLLGSGGPDGFGYRWIDSDDPSGPAYVWVEINSVGTPLAMGDDTYLTGVPMGISFPYYGNVYSSVNISTNGFVSFSAPSGSYYTNGSLPSTTDPDDMVCAYWDDLNANDGGTIYTYQDAANARFIVEWDGVPRYGTSGSQLQTFQIILGADGTIVTQYRSVNNVISSTVGIENADGSDGLEVVFNAAYLHDGLAILFTNAPPISWLTASPSSGLVPAFGSGAVSLDFDATGLTAGTYEAIVRILSNDQDEAVTDIPVTLTIGGATDVVVTPAAPTRFELGRPQPNPFGSLSTVEYAVPDAARALTIAVYDVSGRRVRTLVNGAQPIGRHQVAWDGRDETGRRVASGVYFYRLDTEDVSQVRKVTLLK